MGRRLRVVPDVPARWDLVRFLGAPGAGVVRIHRRRVAEDRVDHAPRRFYVVLAGEQAGVAVQRVAEQALVGGHVVGRAFLHDELDFLADHALALLLDPGPQSDRDVGLHPKAQRVVVALLAAEDRHGRRVEANQDLAHRLGQALADADQERHAGPAPGGDVQSQRGEGLDGRVLRHARLLAVAAELAAHDVGLAHRGHGADELGLAVADRLGVLARGWLHREQRDDLEHVVLHDVADGAGGLVEAGAALDAEALGHRHLDACDVVAVPDRLEEAVREAEEGEVLDRLLAQVMVDPEDRLLGEDLVQLAVERLRGGEVAPERLLDDDPRPVGRATRVVQRLGHPAEERRRDREVVQRSAGAAELALELGEGLTVGIVAVDVAQEPLELGEGAAVDAPVLLQAFLGPLLQLVEVPARLRHADDRDVERARLHHRLEAGEDLLVGEVARRPEEDERIGSGRHGATLTGAAHRLSTESASG